MNAGDSGCTTGMSGRVYSAWTGDFPANGFASAVGSLSAGILALLKSQVFQWSSAIVASLLADQDAWTTVASFSGTWVDYHTTSDPQWAPSSYVIDAMGWVHLRGMVQNGTINTTAFVLPVGYRPGFSHLFAPNTSAGLGRLDIRSDGSVIPVSGGTGFFSLDGISFQAGG